MASISSIPKFAELNLQITQTSAQKKALEYYIEFPHIFNRNFGLVNSYLQKEVGSSSYELSSKLQKTLDMRLDALLDRPLKHLKETSLVEALDLPSCFTPQEKKAEDFVFQELSLEYFKNIQRIQRCLDFLKEPHAAFPSRLPLMTQQVAFGLLEGKSSPFEKEVVLEKIGQGSTCHVEKVLIGQTILAKKNYDSDIEKQRIIEEYQNTLTWSHPSIIKVAHLEASNLYFEHIEGTALSQTDLDLEEGLSIYLSLIQLLSYLHIRRRVHGDAHGENVIVSPDKKTFTLIDFGCCGVFDEDTVYEGDIELLSLHLENFFLKMKPKLSSSLYQEFSDLKKWYQQRQYLEEAGLPYDRMETFLEKCLTEIRLKKRRLA